MRIYSITIVLYALTSCAPSTFKNEDVLTRCWNAVSISNSNDYKFSFEAIILPGTEGGIFARSHICPDNRLGIDYGSETIRSRFEDISDKIEPGQVGVVVRGVAVARPIKRKTDHYMIVEISQLESLEAATRAETARFVAEFNIG